MRKIIAPLLVILVAALASASAFAAGGQKPQPTNTTGTSTTASTPSATPASYSKRPALADTTSSGAPGVSTPAPGATTPSATRTKIVFSLDATVQDDQYVPFDLKITGGVGAKHPYTYVGIVWSFDKQPIVGWADLKLGPNTLYNDPGRHWISIGTVKSSRVVIIRGWIKAPKRSANPDGSYPRFFCPQVYVASQMPGNTTASWERTSNKACRPYVVH